MIDDLGTALGRLLAERLPAGPVMRLDPPSPAWADSSPPTVGLFLHQVLPTDAAGLWAEDRDADGRVVRRTSPEHRYDFSYLVTAWAADVDEELALLGNVLRVVANDPVLPAASLSGVLAGARSPITLAVGPSSDLWAGLGLLARSCLDLVVTAPVPAIAQTALAPRPEVLDLGVSGPAGFPAAVRRPAPRPAARITEGPRRG